MNAFLLFCSLLLVLCTVPSPSLAIRFESSQGVVKMNGKRLSIKGINWYGFNVADMGCVGGLNVKSIASHVSFLKSHGFNALRIPITTSILTDTPKYAIDFAQNPDLRGKSSIQILDALVRETENQRVLVVFDLHSVPGSSATSSFWYSSSFTESQFVAFWTVIIRRYAGNWNVFAIDILNEPHPIDMVQWAIAASRLGSQLIAVNPKLLIFVGGGSQDYYPPYATSFWGTNMQGINLRPVVINNAPNRVVYSPHIYGPSVYMQWYFLPDNFNASLGARWTNDFGYIRSQGLGTVVIGEFGTKLTSGKPLIWWQTLVKYMKSQGLTDYMHWSYNPTSSDTDSIVGSDWKTPNKAMLDYLAMINPAGTVITPQDVLS